MDPHAVTKVGGTQKYWYDGNGNATKRVASDGTYEFVYDAENRLTQLKKAGSVISTFKYDGDGNRFWESTGGVTKIYLGAYYEWTSSTLKKYYYANGVRVAMLDGANLRYLLNDHLGSTAITTNNTGVRQTELRYYAYGKTRYTYGTPPTSFKYTGQRQQGNANEIYFYGARWYDALVGRFLSPDTIVPQPSNPQSLNRYMYVRGNPLSRVDPSGHMDENDNDSGCGTCSPSPEPPAPTEPSPTPPQSRVPAGSSDTGGTGTTPSPAPSNGQDAPPEIKEILSELAEYMADLSGNIVYGENGLPDWNATLSTGPLGEALHACALAVQGVCGVGVGASGYAVLIGVRGSADYWVSATKWASTKTIGAGGYVNATGIGGGANFGVTVLPNANMNNVTGVFVQLGGSFSAGFGFSGEMVFYRNAQGSSQVGYSASFGYGGTAELHGTGTYTKMWNQGPYVDPN